MNEKVVIGPLFTHAGFQSWFLVCHPSRIVAVPMGLWFALTVNKAAMLVVGGAAGGVLQHAGETAGTKHAARLAGLTNAALDAEKGSVAYDLPRMSGIHFKKKILSSSEVILERENGAKTVFGIMNVGDQPGIINALSGRYGDLFKVT